MFLGVMNPNRMHPNGSGSACKPAIHDFSQMDYDGALVWSDERVALCAIRSDPEARNGVSGPLVSNDGKVVLLFEGKIYNLRELARDLGSSLEQAPTSTEGILLRLYQKYGNTFPAKLNGKFAFALWDARAETLLLCRDHLGFEPLYYANVNGRLVFGNSLTRMAEAGLIDKRINTETVIQYLLYCYNPNGETFFQGVRQLEPGHMLCRRGTAEKLTWYWHLSFAKQEIHSDAQYRRELLPLIEDAVRIRIEPDAVPGIFLSGGTDSSAIVSITSKLIHRSFPTFHFCCRGKSFDESDFARFVADRYGADHNEVVYGPDRLALIAEAVRHMDEPFCDLGIEVGTYMVGKAAAGRVFYTLSGEGGDELFGGHPFYLADRAAAVVEHLPGTIVKTMAAIFSRLPESNQKKDLTVKLKRFAYGLSFPPQLLTHRWRICYTPEELRRLCTSGILNGSGPEQLFAPMLKHYEGSDGRDILSRTIYSEYSTLVGFYLRRLGLLKAFSIDARLPLLDVRLVEYAARVPSSLKIRGLSETKYIYRKVLEGILPRKILYDRPKLGHSVPMKNWIRENPGVQQMIKDVLSDGSLKRRGFFKRDYIDRLLKEHISRSHNHSHRLWGLTVLEMWLQTHVGG